MAVRAGAWGLRSAVLGVLPEPLVLGLEVHVLLKGLLDQPLHLSDILLGLERECVLPSQTENCHTTQQIVRLT